MKHNVVETAYTAWDFLKRDTLARPKVIIDYAGLAKACGVYTNRQNLKWIGAVTDLLDAACCRADVPGLCLHRIRTARGAVNDHAWSSPGREGWRDTIANRARLHTWTEVDFSKVKAALDFLVELPPQVGEDGWCGPNATAWLYNEANGTSSGRSVEQWVLG
jgi:hypothetical protein